MKLEVKCECKEYAVFDKESGQIVLSPEAVNNMMTDEQKQAWKKNDEWFKDEAYKQNSD